MKCWNCLKEIPDGTKWCNYCEQPQDKMPVGSPDDIKKALEFFDPETIGQLMRAAASAETAEDFQSMLLVGNCPACGSCHTEDCENDPDVNDVFVARCKQCCAVYCTECAGIFENGRLTAAGPCCPNCGSENTDYNQLLAKDEAAAAAANEIGLEDDDEDDDKLFGSAMYGDSNEGVVTCFDCGAEYCYTCGHLLQSDDETPEE